MEPVKINNAKDWSSIDIFLFSNGQEYSPPRKYHLRAEELQWWAATVSYLGRTHYGSGHSSIELYRLDGRKINDPLELNNGTAYVAVEPPDTFINTGYEDYLLKATRSREKREAQKTYEMSNPDAKCDEDSTAPNITDADKVIRTPDKIPDTTSLKERRNTSSPVANSRPTKPQQRLQRKPITYSKQIQKKKSFDAHTAALKKICVETDKVFCYPKKQFQNKKDSANRKKTVIDEKQVIKNQEEISCCRKHNCVKPKLVDDSKKNSVKSDKMYQLYPFDDDPNVNNNVNKKQPDVNFNKNRENELSLLSNNPELHTKIDEVDQYYGPNSLVVDNAPVQEPYINGKVTDHNQTLEVPSIKKLDEINVPDQSDIPLKSEIPKNDAEQIYVSNNPQSTNYKDVNSHENEIKSNFSVVSEKQISDEYIAQMNKGDILLLKLKIKLKDCKRILNKDNNKNLTITRSFSNLLKAEKISQANININLSGELLKFNDDQTTKNNSLQSILNKLYTESTESTDGKNNINSRLKILNCACHNYSENHENCICDNTMNGCDMKDRIYETILHNDNQKCNETLASCECHNESLKIIKDEWPLEYGDTRQSVNVMSDNRPSITEVNGSRVKYLAQKFEVGKPTKKSNNINTTYNNKQNDFVELTSLEFGPDYEIRDGNGVLRRNCDKSIQTDWTNLLLEARRHENNNYSFHLPSLYFLKQCNI